MKKYYLPFLCVGLLSGTLLSQNTFVTGNAKVKVQPGTLFYHGGSFNVKAAASDDRVIVNDGNIKINGAFVNEVADGKNFVSTYDEITENYGQVIIATTNPTVVSANLNRLTMEKQSINQDDFSWGQFAIPYRFANVGEAYSTLFGGTYSGANRYVSSFMVWDNITRPEYDHKFANIAIEPTDYVILNLTNDSHLMTEMDFGQRLFEYSGTPSNGAYNVTFRPSIYPTSAWSAWKNTLNSHREKYSTYIEEHIRDLVANEDNYGRYYFQFGNPYTSNIDLSRLGQNELNGDGMYFTDLAGVVKISSMDWGQTTGVDVAGVGKVRATWNGTTWAGNVNALIVKPFEGFYIALNDAADRNDRTFSFTDGLKTFANTPAFPGGAGPSNRGLDQNEDFFSSDQSAEAEDRLANLSTLVLSSSSSRSSFYQLGLNLYTEDDIQTGNTVYVVVDTKTQSGIAQPLESDYDDFQKGFFLSQENANGSEVNSPNRIMQINAINPRYVSKPIPLFFQTNEGDMSAYYVKADLFYKNIFSKLNPEDINFVDGNSFFFYDKIQDVLLPITTDFSYYIERPEEAQSSRYVVYWNGGPEAGSERMSVSDEIAGKTEVYKDGETHKIRFNETWSSADIAVYDMTGRSIFKKEGVKTNVDFTLDLPNTSVYVVKIQSNTGETVTQKILR
ncbi:T9SS type A sorting domain-containing protein [Moheibacter sediminis]|uniref:Por secretion system C-terminal sorting domain-containing protein n=1 Tax=Moheibacter sediminis TaxID=1434700 RepID=A0A1W1ZY36_9FLAO|nr:T9SS type A sorting domain-containing protein [Moheibacter sediminis]SMC53314.1 Por secretion system C-terminal sorting domain-containing protein [Moheibacter sediminis]